MSLPFLKIPVNILRIKLDFQLKGTNFTKSGLIYKRLTKEKISILCYFGYLQQKSPYRMSRMVSH